MGPLESEIAEAREERPDSENCQYDLPLGLSCRRKKTHESPHIGFDPAGRPFAWEGEGQE